MAKIDFIHYRPSHCLAGSGNEFYIRLKAGYTVICPKDSVGNRGISMDVNGKRTFGKGHIIWHSRLPGLMNSAVVDRFSFAKGP